MITKLITTYTISSGVTVDNAEIDIRANSLTKDLIAKPSPIMKFNINIKNPENGKVIESPRITVSNWTQDKLFDKYFAEEVVAEPGKTDLQQCYQYLLNEDERFQNAQVVEQE